MRQILTIQLYKFSDQELYSALQDTDRNNFFRQLPDWMINKHGKVTTPEYYLQFIFPQEDTNDAYYFFDVHSADIYIESEINETGVDYKYGVMGDECGVDWNAVFDKLEYQSFSEHRSYSLGKETRLVFDIQYNTAYDYYSEGVECEIETKFIGWLNEDLKLIKR